MKGRIEDFRLLEAGKVTERIQFDIEIDKPLMNLDDKDLDFQVIGVSEKGNSIIRFEVYKNKSTDEDDDSVSKNGTISNSICGIYSQSTRFRV